MHFPTESLLPKAETGAAEFLASNPTFDGRSVTIAILDTGVDPGAPGLQTTPDGKQKVVALIDCTGSGDVDCSKTVSPSADGPRTIQGLSGRTLRLGNWPCPSNQFRIGVKHAADLFPKPLLDRLAQPRKTKFEDKHLAILTQTESALDGAKEASAVGDVAQPITSTSDSQIADPNKPEKQKEDPLIKTDIKTRIEFLKESIKSFQDPGILLDVVVFHDGSTWRAVIDASETGDLTNATPLASYSEEHQFLCFGNDSMLNYSVNIYENGKSVSIVTLAGSHGTHVAAITAAHHPENPALNGVAPGAQIVSLKIGDTRLGSMETGTGLIRAAIELARLDVDLANMSYGEAAALPNMGKFIKLVREQVINKKGVIFVASAGNNGPALTTVGAPGGTSSTIIGVGAYVTHAMMEAEYALLDKVQERPYTWSSRGPTADGDVGVDIFAPGAAITSVPQYTTYRSQLMNGTSMSSPNLCGCLALLLSGLKSKSIPYTPYLIKSAIKSTGKNISDPFNSRFIQINQAWTYLTKTSINYMPINVHYDVAVQTRDNARGIYLRDVVETSEMQQHTVEITPVFMRDDDPDQNKVKLELELRLMIKSSQRWINVPEFLVLNSTARGFNVKVDPTHLVPGVHYGSIDAMDTTRPDIGIIFSIPVIVCKHEPIHRNIESPSTTYYSYADLKFSPGDIQRRFIHVPIGANFVEMVIRSDNRDTPARFIVHTVQLHPQSRYTTFEREYYFTLGSTGSGDENSDDGMMFRKQFAVIPNVTMELCLAQFWSSLDASSVSVDLRFHGVMVSMSASTMGEYGASVGNSGSGQLLMGSGVNGFTRIDISTPIRQEEVVPSITFDTLRKVIRPARFTVMPLSASRDVLPDTRQLHELVLIYTLRLNESNTATPTPYTVTPFFPRITNMLYDACIDNFSVYVHDTFKRAVSFQDVYPKPIQNVMDTMTYTIRVQVVSSMIDVLDKLSTMCCVVDVGLPKSVSVPVYGLLEEVVTANSSGVVKRKQMKRGQRATMWAGDIAAANGNGNGIPNAKAGDMLIGKMDVVSIKLDGVLFKVMYVVPPEPASQKDAAGNAISLFAASPTSDSADANKPKLDMSALKEAVRDLEIAWLKKLVNEDDRDALAARLEKEFPGHLPLLRQKLEMAVDKFLKIVFDASKPFGQSGSGHVTVPDDILQRLLAASEAILSVVDESKLAQYFGVQRDSSSESQRTEKKEMDFQRDVLANAYRWKSVAYKYMVGDNANAVAAASIVSGNSSAESVLPPDATNLKLFDANLAKYAAWLTTNPPTGDGVYLLLWSWRHRLQMHFGAVLKNVSKFVSDSKAVAEAGGCDDALKKWVYGELVALRICVLRELGWAVWAEYDEKWRSVKHPPSYASFQT